MGGGERIDGGDRGEKEKMTGGKKGGGGGVGEGLEGCEIGG